jgi:hypothetical protein
MGLRGLLQGDRVTFLPLQKPVCTQKPTANVVWGNMVVYCENLP